MNLDDKAIRCRLKNWLMANHPDEADLLIADEVALAQQRVRADVVMVNGCLHGFEIKSAKDTLNRLREQAYWYSTIFDRVSLVSVPGHVEAALAIVPAWWEVLLVDDGGTAFSVLREGQVNPTQDPSELARLLWSEEAARLLERHGLMKGMRGKPRYRLHEFIAERIELQELRAYVIACLKSRPDWRAATRPS